MAGFLLARSKSTGNHGGEMNHKSGLSVEAGEMARLRSSLSAEETRDLAMIECESCHNFGFSRMVYSEVETILCDGSVSRFCPKCNKTTNWRQVAIHAIAQGPKGGRAHRRRGPNNAPDKFNN